MSHERLTQNSGIQTTPRESAGFGDLSHDLAVKQNKSDIIKIGGIGGAAAAGIFLASSIRSVDAQSDGSAVDPCASPSASILFESPIPSEAPFSATPDGSPVITVTASPEIMASPLPSQEVNSQALNQSNETIPESSPKPSNTPSSENQDCDSPTASLDLGPTGKEALKLLITQKDIDEKDTGVDKTSFSAVKKAVISRFWNKYSNDLNLLKDPDYPNQQLTREALDWYLDVILHGKEDDAGITRIIHENRLRFSAGFAAFLLKVRDETKDPQIRHTALRAADSVVEYAFTSIAGKGKEGKNDKNTVKEYLKDNGTTLK